MYLKKKRDSTDPHLRSLVQKAVRRGYGRVAKAALAALLSNGDGRWIRSRAAVMSAEECWPSLLNLESKSLPSAKVDWISALALTRKQKDAAGLGSLAFAASEEDLSVFNDSEDDRVVRIVAAGIRRSEEYWSWILREEEARGKTGGVQKIRSFMAWPTWPWDKAFVMASAYLFVHGEAKAVEQLDDEELRSAFPFWIAIDKHTAEGKVALRKVAKIVGCTYRQLNWTSYYLESARVNALSPSHWWQKERLWRLGSVGLLVAQAEELWSSAHQLMASEVEPYARLLEKKLDAGSAFELR